jgi:hypothetical protein
MNNWIRTDGTQFIKKINNTTFEVVEVVGADVCGFKISQQTIDIEDLTEEDIQDVITGFGYESIDDVKNIYGDDYAQIIAECEAETNWNTIDNLNFDTEDEAIIYIENNIISL